MQAAESTPSPRATGGALRPRFLDRRAGALLIVTMLTVGAVVLPGLGWLIGVLLLWSSSGWRRVDQIVGTVVGPVGLAVPLVARQLFSGGLEPGQTAICGGGFCAPSVEMPWYVSVSTVGEALVVLHLALAVYLLARFHPLAARAAGELG